MPKKITKADRDAAISQLSDIMGELQAQAKEGQIDESLLNQAAALASVSVDQAPVDPRDQSSMASDASSTSTEAGSDSVTTSSTPSSAPSMSSAAFKAEDPSTTTEDEIESEPSSEPETEKESTTMAPEDIKKGGDLPLEGRPPLNTPALVFDHKDDFERRVPDFLRAMESNRVADAQKIAGNSIGFDTLFNMSQRAILNEGGWTSENMGKLGGMGSLDPQTGLTKAITATSVPGYYLIRLAKLMLPVYAGLINRIPTQTPDGMHGATANWKAQLGFGTLTSPFRIAEAAVGVTPPTSFLTFTSPFQDLSVNDNVTLKSIYSGKGYSDPLQIGVIKAMSALLRQHEQVTLGANSGSILPPTTVTAASAAGGGGTGAFSIGSFVIGVSALTYEGWSGSATGSAAATGSSLGETTITWSGSVNCATGSAISASRGAVEGAVAYNIFCGSTQATATYVKTVVTTKTTVTGSLAGNVPNGVNTTGLTTSQAGLIEWAEKTICMSNTIPSKATIYDGAGSALTAGNGGIVQFDSILADVWTKWHSAPSVMVMSPLMNATLVGKLQGLGSGGFYRIEVGNERNTVNGGMMVTGYVNKFAPFADGTPRMIDVIPHPYMPDGTVLFLSETIPYPMGNETRGFVRDILVPYTYFPLPSQTSGTNSLIYNFAITTSEALECFNPGCQSALVGIDYTL